MKIFITNDDGIGSEGLRALASWAKKFGEITVVAPKREQSCKSHAIDLVNAYEIKKVPFIEGIEAYCVDSTPADCVRFGIVGLGRKYDLVLSGINHGVNIGEDIVYSGTIGAAQEAAKQGCKAIAFSAHPKEIREAAKFLDDAYEYLTKRELLQENPIYNINIPACPKGIRMTYQGTRYYDDRFEKAEGENMYRQVGDLREDDCPDDLDRDTVALKAGYMTITPLMETRTNRSVFEKYRARE